MEMVELSVREGQLLIHIANGLSNKQIAAELGITPDTVRSHLVRVMYKMNARNRAHVVSLAVKQNMINLEDVKCLDVIVKNISSS